MFGSPETTPGGKALKFYASIRLDVRKIDTLKDGANSIGNRTRVKVVKNKLAPPFKTAEFDILYGQGISKSGELIDVAINLEIIEKSGSWFFYDGNRIAQGKDNTRKYILDNPELAAEIETKLREALDKERQEATAAAEAKRAARLGAAAAPAKDGE